MAQNILDYIVTDLYYDLMLRAYADRVSFPVTNNTQLRQKDYDPKIVEQVGAEGLADDLLPHQIYMNNFDHKVNKRGQYHTSDDNSSINIGAMNLFWYNAFGQNHREHGPATVRVNRLSKWHKDGLLYRPKKAIAIACKSVRFEWIYDTLYHREDGPEMVELHEVQMSCVNGAIQEVGVRKINYRWTIEDQPLDKTAISKVLQDFNFGIDILALDSVFKNDTDSFNFYNELVTEGE